MTVCEDIARWATSLRVEDLPPTVCERARLQAADMLAAATAGAQPAEPIAATVSDHVLGELYGRAAASMAHDWDDYLFMGHTSHSAVWAARAFAAEPDALVVQVAANEVSGRLGAALLLGPHNGQLWASIHCAGGAVATGLGLGLDAERLAHALAIALYQPPYGLVPGFMGPGSKLLTAAEPAAQGARAALLAAEGLEGSLDIIENPRGLLASLSFAPRPAMLGALGRVWLTDTLAYKPYPGCAYLQAAVDAALVAGVSAKDVASVDVAAGYLTCGMEELGAGGSLTPVGVNFSTGLSVAVALLAGRLTHRELAPGWLVEHEPELRRIAARVRVRHEWELTAQTIRGAVEAGATLADVPSRAWPRVRRRLRELNMGEAALGSADLLELLRRPGAGRAIGGALLRALRGPGGIEGLDTESLRLTFPCRLEIRLRSGRTLEIEGRERGSCGSPPHEQRAVVEEKSSLAGVDALLQRRSQ